MLKLKIDSPRNAIAMALTLLSLLIILIFYINHNIFFIILPFIILAILFIIGIKRPFHVLVVGAIMICALSPCVSYVDYQGIVNHDKSILLSEDGSIHNGTFTFDRWTSGIFYFSVQIDDSIDVEEVRLHLINTWEVGLSKNKYYSMNQVSYSDDILTYGISVNDLLEGIYLFNFIVVTEQETFVTDEGYGPINADDDRIFETTLYNGVFRTALISGFLFLVLVFMLWWLRVDGA